MTQTNDPNREITLDLTAGGVLAPALLRRLDELAVQAIEPFDRFIADLSKGHAHDIDWWVSRPASRNTFVSSLFQRCVQLLLIQELLRVGTTVRVRLDQPALAEVLGTMGEPGLHVECEGAYWSRVVQMLRDIASSLFHTIFAAMAARRTRASARTLPDGPLTAIDVVVMRDSFAKGQFDDRYFGGIREALAPEEWQRICYIPTFYRVRKYYSLFRALRRDEMNFLVPQDRLTWSDHAFAFGHWWRARKFRGLSERFAGVAMDALVRDDLMAGRFARSAISALLTYRFWTRHADPRIRQIINWYEGQDIDHALAAALRWSGSDVRHVGFRSPCSRFELSVTPAAHEVASGVVPPIMAVVGNRFYEEIRAALPTLRTEPAPGLRYQHLHSVIKKSRQGPTTILVTLPLARSSLAGMRALIAPGSAGSTRHGWRWHIKRHPAMPQPEAERLFGGALPAGFEFVDGDFYDCLKDADIVIGLESSALLEAVALGIPALCLARSNIPTKIPFPTWADRRLWRVCYDAEELSRSIVELLAEEPSSDLAALREDLLSPATPEKIRSFLGLSPT